MKEITLPNGDIVKYIDELTALDVYDEIYNENLYLKNGIQINNGDIVFDVGANIGLFSRYISTQAKGLMIFAFEPIPVIFEILKKNTNEIEADLKLFNIGLGESNEEIEFYYFPNVSADSAAVKFDLETKVDLYVRNYRESICKFYPIARIVPGFLRRIIVKMGLKRMYKAEKLLGKIRPLSDIIEEYHLEKIDLLKIDAENYEKQVLIGIRESDWYKIKQIVVEVHEHIKGGENLLMKIKTLFEEKGFKTIQGEDTRRPSLGVYMLYARRDE